MRAVRALAVCAIASVSSITSAQEVDWKKVDEALGRTAAVSGDVHRYGFPRSDLQVAIDGVTIRPAFALGGWVAFKPAHGGAMIMGDLVLLETEINPVMSKLIENGVEITAIHNHVLRANPATFYMHVGGHGDAVKLATAIRTALQESKTPLTPPTPPATPPAIDLDTAQLEHHGGKGPGQRRGLSIRRAAARFDQRERDADHSTRAWSSSGPRPTARRSSSASIDGVHESEQSWREFLFDLKRRGLAMGPELAVADGALGFWQAVTATRTLILHIISSWEIANAQALVLFLQSGDERDTNLSSARSLGEESARDAVSLSAAARLRAKPVLMEFDGIIGRARALLKERTALTPR
jgi:Domain of Unknown Function (DUF1259)